ELLAIAGDGLIRQPEDRRRAAVVREQAQLLALRMAFGELEDVLEVRAAEGVDALRIVADDQQVPMRRRGDVDDLALQAVGILVLVDKHCGKPPADALARDRHLDEQPFPVQEQVVEIHRVHLRLALREAAGDTQDLLFQRVSTRQSLPTRAIISPAALLVNVSSRIFSGGVPVSSTCATRYVSPRVFPEPAPAITSVGRASQSATARCSSERSRS